jgi:hypothetical protein
VPTCPISSTSGALLALVVGDDDHPNVVANHTAGAPSQFDEELGRCDDRGLRCNLGVVTDPVMIDVTINRDRDPNDLRNAFERVDVLLADVAGVSGRTRGDPRVLHPHLARPDVVARTVDETDDAAIDTRDTFGAPDNDTRSVFVCDNDDNHYAISNLVGRYAIYYTLI